MNPTLLNKICEQYSLGKLYQIPKFLTGGFLHQMYSLFTDTGKLFMTAITPVWNGWITTSDGRREPDAPLPKFPLVLRKRNRPSGSFSITAMPEMTLSTRCALFSPKACKKQQRRGSGCHSEERHSPAEVPPGD